MVTSGSFMAPPPCCRGGRGQGSRSDRLEAGSPLTPTAPAATRKRHGRPGGDHAPRHSPTLLAGAGAALLPLSLPLPLTLTPSLSLPLPLTLTLPLPLTLTLPVPLG